MNPELSANQGFKIEDSQITVSSKSPDNADGFNARAGLDLGYGAWCPAGRVSESSYEWIQVKLSTLLCGRPEMTSL